MDKLKIAVIGCGISGLSTAYELRRNAQATGTELDIMLFEKQATLGGNADTVVVNLGKKRSDSRFTADYQRWADMGVNDINLTAYTRIAKIMREIGYFNKDDPGDDPKMQKLENTETYFSWDDNILLTGDEELEHGVSNPAFTIKDRHKGHFAFWIDVLHKAADAVVGNGDKLNIDITCKAFFDQVISDPKKMLEPYVCLDIDCDDPCPEIDWDDPGLVHQLIEARDYIFYPRISAMYFANDMGPENMLLAAPMCYYRIQESKDSKEPADRRYFVGGSNRWLQALRDNLLDNTNGEDLVTITYKGDYAARVNIKENGVQISADNSPEIFDVDHCVITTHADDAARLLDFECNKDTAFRVMKILQSISYTQSIAVCHTYAGVMPSNQNQWRSYNVLIRKGASLKPYSMSYVCNRHQNDAAQRGSEYNRADLPKFFVTLNPQREIPDDYILRVVSENEVEPSLRAELPQFTSPDANGLVYSRLKAGDRAVVSFKHNLIDKRCFLAQRELINYHESAKNLYFAGGWSNGSGLHEECWQQAERVAKLIIPASQC